MKKLIIYFAIPVTFLSLSFTAGFNPFNTLFIHLPKLIDSTRQEKVHLHLDKPYYVAGDNIWFKAYVLDEHSLSPSTISSVLYVDLIHENKVVRNLKLPLENGITWGDFKLSDSIPEGNYRIRAYTQWMRNAGENYFFDKIFPIVNNKIEKKPLTTVGQEEVEIQFFPEGGHLIKGIPTKVAVKAVNSDGNGKAIEGTVIRPDGEMINFTTNDLGLGYFIFTATSLERQKVSIIFKNGSPKVYDLPKVEAEGYSLMLKANGFLQIYLSAEKLNAGLLSLVGQRNGIIYFKQFIPTVKQMASITIPTNKLPSGLLQLNLLNPEDISVCERFVFINNDHDKLDLSVEGLKTSYGKRSPVELLIDITQQGLPMNGNFSVSVTNTSIVGTDLDNETNILASFLLNADAVSRIKGPNRYMDQQVKQDLDLLMLTRSWRSIPKKSAANRKPLINNFEPEKTLTISGTLTDKGKPVAKGKVTLVKSDGGFDMLSTTTDEMGKFHFDSLMFGDSTKLMIQARTSHDKKNVKILIDQVPPQTIGVRSSETADLNIEKKIVPDLLISDNYLPERTSRTSLNEVTQLKVVEITGGRNLKESYVRLHGKADQEFTSKELDSAAFLSQVLVGKIRGSYRDYDIMLNGVFLEPAEREYFFLTMEPSSLQSIEALSSPHLVALYKPKDLNKPLLIIETKKTQNFAVKYAPGVTTLTPKGFSFSRTFQSPDYELQNDPRPDLRTTVYWNPNLSTDENGKLKIKYFNTDMPGKYRIVIEGIGGNRGLARKEIYYEVK